MFTGIIEEIGTIREIRLSSTSAQLTIAARDILSDMKVGDSINTDGVCLTVTSFTTVSFTADVMPETMKRSGLSALRPGSRVNLERALRLSDRLGGHLVSGHIDDTGNILKTWKDENAIWFSFSIEKHLLKYIVEKGSVAIDGISLTVARVDDHSFDVSVIPHTQLVTLILAKSPGNMVNIECDLIAKYIEKLLPGNNEGKKLDMKFLTQQGFI
ncbi:MAG: riboflavin synthase [Bacteroidetes bacterium]|nr:riboflavin synthase [Bacteroidota bacterium]